MEKEIDDDQTYIRRVHEEIFKRLKYHKGVSIILGIRK
jgi:hypothetical protein